MRTNRFLYAEHLTTGEYELYDLRRDPYELAQPGRQARYAPMQRDLTQRLRRLKQLRRPRLPEAARAEPARALRRAGPIPDGGCARGDLRVRIGGRDRAAHDAGRDLRSGAGGSRQRRRRRQSPSGSATRASRGARLPVRVRAELRDGRRLTLDRRLRGCR